MARRLLLVACCVAPFVLRAAAQDAPAPPTFQEWLVAVRAEAMAKGISQATVDAALGNLEPEPLILSRDRTQPEQTQSLDQYLAARITPKTVARAREVASTHAALLERVRAEYGVSAPIMVAIWGAESNFGRVPGIRPIVTALATLAYDARRPELFRNELFAALSIVDRGLVSLPDLKGSWAGAMGQPQFMPTSYLKYAVDFDGDGHANIWTSDDDVLASMANYLETAGWKAGESWGREVRISRTAMSRIDKTVPMRAAGCRAVRDLTEPRPLSQWKKLGVTLAGGKPLPASSLEASLVRGQQRHFLVYRNYHAILDYNCSNSYAVGVGVMADKVAAK